MFRASVGWPAAPTFERCARYGLARPILSLRDFARQPCACYALQSEAATLESQDSPVAGFGGLKLGDDLALALSEQRLSSPTEIQASFVDL